MNKVSYKFELLYVKFAPYLVALYIFVQGFFHIPYLDYFIVPSILTMVRLYNSLLLYKFCIKQWVTAIYITINIPLIAMHTYWEMFDCSLYRLIHFSVAFIYFVTLLIIHSYAKKCNKKCAESINKRFRQRFMQHVRDGND